LANTRDYSTFVSIPADLGDLSVDSYLSGIVCGILEGAGFPARVTAHSVALEESETSQARLKRKKAVFLIKFDQAVIDRESRMG